MTTKVPLSWPILFSTRASNSCWTRDVEMQIRHAKRVKRHQCAWQNGHNSLKYTRSGLLAFLASIMGRPFAGPPQGAQQDLGQSLFFSISNLIAWMHGVFEYLSSDCGPWELLDRALLPSHFARSRSHDWPHSTLPSYINGPAFGEPSLWICFNFFAKKLFMDWKEPSILPTGKQQLGDFQPTWMANWSWWALPKPDLFAMFGCWRPGETKRI